MPRKLKANALVAVTLISLVVSMFAFALSGVSAQTNGGGGSSLPAINCSTNAQFADTQTNCDYAPQFNTTGLVAYYPMQEGSGLRVFDLTNNNPAGSLVTGTGGFLTGTSCQYYGCLNFDGSATSVSIGVSGLPSGSSGRTVSMWVDVTTSHTAPIWFAYGGFAVSFDVFGVGIESSQFAVYIKGAQCASGFTPSLNTWYFLNVEYPGSGTSVDFDVNGGQFTGSCNLGHTPNTNVLEGSIGNFEGSNFASVKLEELKVYNIALSSKVIHQSFSTIPYPYETQFQVVKSSIPQVPYNATGIQLYYPMDENTGTKVYDLSGSGNTGTMSVTPPTWAAGSSCKYGNCLDFVSSSSENFVSTSTIATPRTQGYISIWFYESAAQTGSTAILFGSSSTNNYVGITTSDHVLCSLVFGTLGQKTVFNSLGPAITHNIWHNEVCTWSYNGSTTTVSLYIDGALSATGTFSDEVATDTHTWAVGGHGTNFYNGFLDDARMADISLSAFYVVQLYLSFPIPTEIQYNALGTSCSAGQYLTQNNIPSSCSSPTTTFIKTSTSCNITTTSDSMVGLDTTYTVSGTGNLYITMNFQTMETPPVGGDNSNYVFTYGSGSVPTCGAAATGTEIGHGYTAQITNSNETSGYPRSITVILTGLSAGTYWFDLTVSDSNANTWNYGFAQTSVLET